MRYTGHRGAMGYMPENTLASFRRAVREGVDEVELDLRLSKDHALVVVHDATVDRTTDGTGVVADLTVADLRGLDAGDGEQIPTFGEVLDAITGRIFAEVKAPEVVEPLLDLFRRRPSLRERVDVIGFDVDAVGSVRRSAPAVRVALLSATGSRDLVDTAHEMGAVRVGVGWDGTSNELIEYAHSLGLEYGVWPAPTRAHIERALAMGADEITTDYPCLIAERAVRR